MSGALGVLARALGIPRGGGCACAVCDESACDPAGSVAAILGENFTAFDALRAPHHPTICIGCQRLMSGRPGDDPPPLRMTSLYVSPGGDLSFPDRAGFFLLLQAPPAYPCVLSWARSKKRHHWLHAGISGPDAMLIGSDDGPIRYVPTRDRAVMDAVCALVAHPSGFSRTSVLTGQYEAPAIAKYGAQRWRELEATVAPARPCGLVALFAWCTPEESRDAAENMEELVIDPNDDRAARLLGAIARGSSVRAMGGLMFWGGFFRHRVERFARLPLADFVSRLLDECRVDAPSAEHATTLLRAFTAEEIDATERALRERGALVVALSYDYRKGK